MAIGRTDEELILLDTHVWIWSFEPSPRLDREHLRLIEENYGKLVISAASLWEVSMLVSKKRIDLGYPLQQWFELATSGLGILTLPLSAEVAREAYQLPGKFHEDPADRLIVATARIHNCLLLTEDSKIRKYPHVKVG
jgi:PIN domain nuclease of toxin-antitoxin system